MNKERRKEIQNAADLIRKAQETIEEAKEVLETVKADEEEYYDNMPESIQNGEKGSQAQTAIDALDNAISDLEGFDFDQIETYLNEATE